MIPPTTGLIAHDLTKPQKIADGLREMAARQPDELVRSVMEIAADALENQLDMIAAYHRELAALVDASTPEGGA